VGLGYLIPPLGALLERPFARIRTRRPSGRGGGFVLGLALGVLYVPCAGPVLAAITVVGATHHVGLTAVFVTAAFAVGTALPLLAIALAGQQLTQRVSALRRHARQARFAGGAVLIVMAAAIAFNTFQGLERVVPGYSTALQGSASVRNQLNGLTSRKTTSLTKCKADATVLVNCGKAPGFTGISSWLNTPGGQPLALPQLHGKVVLVDFWTYSCINCQRALPHVEAWYRDYAKDGLVVVGVHTPEFAFEHVVSNVRSQSADLGVRYPVAVDNGYGTWNAYGNEYWPADYLIDASGQVRYAAFGEGDYDKTETAIRALLAERGAPVGGRSQPHGVIVPSRQATPETYLGSARAQGWFDGPHEGTHDYGPPPSGRLALNEFAFSGTWSISAQPALAGSGAGIDVQFQAKDVYLVLSSPGERPLPVRVLLDGRAIDPAAAGTDAHEGTVTVRRQRLYSLVSLAHAARHRLSLRFAPGISGYAFTFG
jgi:thiol-disulfide isomerase/thioredoxin